MSRIVKICSPFFNPTGNFERSLLALYSAFMNDPGIDFDPVRDVKRTGPTAGMFHARSACLGVAPHDMLDVLPWHGEEEYDDIIWLDNDMVFEPWMVYRLLLNENPLVSAIYPMGDSGILCAGILDDNGMAQTLSTIDLSQVDMGSPSATGFLYTGMGFCKTSKGVLENTERPWFDHLYLPTEGYVGRGQAMMLEDVSFMHRAGKAGFDVAVDLYVTAFLGHEKSKIYRAGDGQQLQTFTPDIEGDTIDHMANLQKTLLNLSSGAGDGE